MVSNGEAKIQVWHLLRETKRNRRTKRFWANNKMGRFFRFVRMGGVGGADGGITALTVDGRAHQRLTAEKAGIPVERAQLTEIDAEELKNAERNLKRF